jgi:hypothetical protein
MAKDETPRNADFIGRVVGDPGNPPETRMLNGWLGAAAEEGYRRLYYDAELTSYADIPADAILYSEEIRDVQPSGSVLLWIKRDAVLKPGGSAASRAARFLRGQVQEDFAGAADAKPPAIGGGWPCITAFPHCAEPTGFTGQCTHQPWPNPTRYIGCTFLHCPTHDLTHIPHICNIVASGMPGCGGEQQAPAAGEDPAAIPPKTTLPGCGFTKLWGSCETHLLGCGQTKDCPTTMPGCGFSRNPICTDLPGCGFTKPLICQPTVPPKCQVSIDIPCITQTEVGPRCQPVVAGFDTRAQEFTGAISAICATNIGCDITTFCATRQPIVCVTKNQPMCFPVAFAQAPQQAVPTPVPGCIVSAIGAVCPTPGCTVPPTQLHGCTQSGPQCPSQPKTMCTHAGPQCPTSCGPECQTQQETCTKIGPACHDMCEPQPTPACPSVGIICSTHCPAPAITTAEQICLAQAAAATMQPCIRPTTYTQPLFVCTQTFHCAPTPATVCTQHPIVCPQV